MGLSAVIDDFNGDGKLDIVAASSSFSSGTTTYYLSFLAGKGDGTFPDAAVGHGHSSARLQRPERSLFPITG